MNKTPHMRTTPHSHFTFNLNNVQTGQFLHFTTPINSWICNYNLPATFFCRDYHSICSQHSAKRNHLVRLATTGNRNIYFTPESCAEVNNITLPYRIVSYRCRETQAWKPLCPPPCITLYNNNISL